MSRLVVEEAGCDYRPFRWFGPFDRVDARRCGDIVCSDAGNHPVEEFTPTKTDEWIAWDGSYVLGPLNIVPFNPNKHVRTRAVTIKLTDAEVRVLLDITPGSMHTEAFNKLIEAVRAS